MNAKKFIAAAAVFVAAGSAFAADGAAAAAAAPVAASANVIAANLNLPTVSISAGASRADVRAEAVEFVKHHKTAFAVQLEQYQN